MRKQTIGDHFYMDGWIDSSPIGELVIGDYVVLGHGARIIAHGPIRPWKYQRIEIGDLCYIGDNVRILLGAKIGRGCVIGTLSVVGEEIPAFSIAAGNPVRVIRIRDPYEILRTFVLKYREPYPKVLGTVTEPNWDLLTFKDVAYVLDGYPGLLPPIGEMSMQDFLDGLRRANREWRAI